MEISLAGFETALLVQKLCRKIQKKDPTWITARVCDRHIGKLCAHLLIYWKSNFFESFAVPNNETKILRIPRPHMKHKALYTPR